MFLHSFRRLRCLLVLVSMAASSLACARASEWLDAWRKDHPVWRGVHLTLHGARAAADLEEALPALAAAGVNVVIAEVNYGFAFESHPELRNGSVLTREQAQHLAAACHARGIRLIPGFNCLGHQSWSRQTFPLLTRYPEFDETPGKFPNNEGIYCRSWCPQNPDVAGVVFPLLDELASAFDADALHVGMDEVFLIGSELCPRCKGGDPARLFSRAVNDLHRHVVGERGLEMLMWADRLLDGRVLGYGKWEASLNGTHSAVDTIPKDIILCDWHYELPAEYPGRPTEYGSIPFLLQKGFRVWPGGWKNAQAAETLAREALQHRSDRMLGTLCTTWGAVKVRDLADWEPLRRSFAVWPDSGGGAAKGPLSTRPPD